MQYRATSSPDLHRARRLAILREHPEVRDLFGFDPMPKYKMTAVLALQLAIAWGIAAAHVGRSARFALLVALAYAVGAMANHYGGVVIHEASHNSCARGTVANRVVAIYANLPKVLPYAMTFRRHHMLHHVHLGVIGKDNDLPPTFERDMIGNGRARKLLWLFFYPFFGAFCRGFLHVPDRWEVASWVVQTTFNLALWTLLGPWALAYLAASTYFSASLHPIAGHFIHEHYLWDESQETYSYYGPLNRVTLNLGLHNEHHDFPRVPGRDLPRLHAIARAHYAPLVSHASWTGIFREFVANPRLSHHSRIVRP